MVPSPTKLVVLLATAGIVLSGAVGVVGADRAGPAATDLDDPPTAVGTDAAPGPPPADQEATRSSCAVEPTDSLVDPPRDVLGWENGTWYNEPIAVDQSDGLNRSEQSALVARAMARVEFLRCIEFDRGVPVSVIGREQFRQRQTGQNYSAALRTFDNAKFEAMFLINESTDSLAVQQRNRGSSVLGFYSPRRDEIVVVAESRETLRIDEFTLAHELMHALQDQTFNLSSPQLRPRLRDDANARNGLVEGSASYVEHLYQQRCEEGAWNGTCRPAARGGGGGQLANIGVYLLKFQPYSDGPTFVRTVHTVGGWDAVDALYDRPPASTEQVVHVDRYGVDAPVDPALEDRTSDEWTRVTPPGRPNYASVGEAGIMTMFVYPYYHSEGDDQILPPTEWLNFDERGEVRSFDPLDYESNYSEGWDGDRLHVYRNGSNATAYVWRLEWDSPQDAREFVDGYRKVLQYRGAEEVGDGIYRIDEGGFADAFHVSVDGTTVTVVNAPTVDQLDEVRTDLDGGSAAAARGPTGPFATGHRGVTAVRR